jgi:hypothetical protein
MGARGEGGRHQAGITQRAHMPATSRRRSRSKIVVPCPLLADFVAEVGGVMAAGALLELTACHPRHDGAPVEAARRTTARLPLLRRRKRATTAASIGLRRAPTPRQVFRERRSGG